MTTYCFTYYYLDYPVNMRFLDFEAILLDEKSYKHSLSIIFFGFDLLCGCTMTNLLLGCF